MKTAGRTLGLCLWLLAALGWIRIPASAQQPADSQSELQELKSQVKKIEARIDALEAAQAQAAAARTVQPGNTGVAASTPASPSNSASVEPAKAANGPEAVKEAQDQGMDTMDAGMGGEVIKIPIIPALKIRGFGDVRAYLANQNLAVINDYDPGVTTIPQQGGNSTFTLGGTDLFVTSKISEHFSYLSEIVFDADPINNAMGVDLERTQVSFTPSDKFSMNIGRSHSMLGYYNTAFHHGTWFQTTIDRPHMFNFEDSGGPLPVHNVGVEAMGKLPGALGLHWLAEVGNGKQTWVLEAGPNPTNKLADHTGKSTNVGLFIRPERFSGLQAGFDWFHASLVPVVADLPGYGTPAFAFPNAVNYYQQNIFVAHAVYIKPNFEFMAEDAEIRDVPRGSTQPMYTSGGYAQISKVFKEQYRPYVRYEWMNPNFNDPNNAWAGRWVGPVAGLRWDMNTFIALKTEYSHFDWKDFSTDPGGNQILPILHKSIELAGTQLTFTF
jgi:hypothetical protein